VKERLELGARNRIPSPRASRQVPFQQAGIHDERAISPIADETSFAKFAQCHRHMCPTHRGHFRKFLMAHPQGNLAGIFRFNSALPGGESQQQSSEPCLASAPRCESISVLRCASVSRTHMLTMKAKSAP
jgi:hypothetical protein